MKKNVLTCMAIGMLALALFPFATNAQTISTIAGYGIGDNGTAATAELMRPADATVDNNGNIYVIELLGNRVRKIDAAGKITTIAGTGANGVSGDGGPATAATLRAPSSLAQDRHGNIYIVDQGNDRVRKVSTSGIITTFAGSTPGYFGDGGQATDAQLEYPNAVIVDSLDNVFIADMGNNVVREVSPSGLITTIAGTGTGGYNGDGISSTSAELSFPSDIAFDKAGNLYIADKYNSRIRMVDLTGMISTVAGTGTAGDTGDSGPATAAEIIFPRALAIDTAGTVFFAEDYTSRIRQVSTSGIITAFAGTGTGGYSGDGGLAITAKFGSVPGIATDIAGNVYLADQDNNRLRMIDKTATITSIAGRNGVFDDGPALNAEISTPYNIATDDAGNVYIPDTYNSTVRKITTDGKITTVAGVGIAGNGFSYSGDGGPATNAAIWNPYAVAVDKNGNIFIADYTNSMIRKVDAAGIITTIAGGMASGYAGDNGPATDASLFGPSGVAVDTAGNVYIADVYNYAIRKVDTKGIITTFAGGHDFGYAGDGGPATDATMDVSDVATDKYGNVFIADGDNNVVRKVNAAGTITTIAGNGNAGFSGDGGPATTASFFGPGGVKVDNDGNVYVSDFYNNRIRMINGSGIISTIAGNGVAGYSGDGGRADAAAISGPTGVAIDVAGNIYIADGNNYRVRKIRNTLGVPAINISNAALAVYPNPTTNMVMVTNIADCAIRLLDATGKQVMAFTTRNNTATIDLRMLPSGVYILQATNSDGTRNTVKVTKQ